MDILKKLSPLQKIPNNLELLHTTAIVNHSCAISKRWTVSRPRRTVQSSSRSPSTSSPSSCSITTAKLTRLPSKRRSKNGLCHRYPRPHPHKLLQQYQNSSLLQPPNLRIIRPLVQPRFPATAVASISLRNRSPIKNNLFFLPMNPPVALPANPEQHLGGEEQHHCLPHPHRHCLASDEQSNLQRLLQL